jgi:3-(3-hydroxy-phenyl)propionate hydroxylase
VLADARAGGFQSRTVEVFDQRGIADRFLAEGQTYGVVMFGGSVLDMSDFPTRHPYTLAIWQKQIERIMADWIAELAGPDLLRPRGDRVRTGRGRRRCANRRSNLIAEAEMIDRPEQELRHDAAGVHAIRRMEDGKTFRVVVTEQQLGADTEPTLRDQSEALIGVFGSDYGIHNPTWISRFTDATRQAAAYRAGRVLLAGDAAQIHYPGDGACPTWT